MEQASDYNAYYSGARDYGKNLKRANFIQCICQIKNIIRSLYVKVVSDVCSREVIR